MTVRMNITMDDDLAARLRVASDDKLSDYIARAVRRQMLEDELKTLPDADQGWADDAEQAAEHVLFDRA
ncbi:hypothetical protein DFR70_1307 [Nocardia tenerifensis]|uniref:Post-segregation antitoxin CcdA n=1 Tax=Nocardia tenerifensis TaxID=228006 RepID=A0A318JSH8_9NOCA|nr:hypothetical protein [Nocardia tenerifensis]PXX52759.1 hypothetical protein DFR70_1307 [Nocardia tenerifensis]